VEKLYDVVSMYWMLCLPHGDWTAPCYKTTANKQPVTRLTCLYSQELMAFISNNYISIIKKHVPVTFHPKCSIY